MNWHPDQLAAIALATDPARRICVITGSPGTGKSTTVKAIVEKFEAQKLRVSLCGPTGKSALRLSQQTGRRATTVHRLLEPTPPSMRFARGPSLPLDADVVVADECSMIDIKLMASLTSALSPSARLILVGDRNQLPAVGPGNVLGDAIDSGAIPSAELTTIKRQNPGVLLRAIHEIKDGRTPAVLNASGDDLFFDDREQADAAKIAASVVDLVLTRLPKRIAGLDVLRDVQVITAHRDKGELSCDALNKTFQERLFPRDPASTDTRRFRVGDKVIQKKNDYERGIYNGDIGYVRGYAKGSDGKPMIEVEFDPVGVGAASREVEVPAGENDLQLAYAIATHAFQGSEARVIVVPLHKQQSPRLLTRPWIYTAVSRARELCVLVGSRAVFGEAVKRTAAGKRVTCLASMIRAGKAEAVA